MAFDESERDDLLDRLVEEFAARLRRGERPALKEYTDRHPDLADEICELFPAMAQVEHAKEICQDWDEAGREDAPAAAPPPAQVGDYRIIREIGRGGMGVVYEAEQVSLGRRVALKVLSAMPGRDGMTLARFRREARASARLHHTNIVPVFDVGQDGDVRYYAMQFIHGQSLDSVIRELRKVRDRSRREPGGHDEERVGEPGTRGIDAEAGVARSLLTGQFQRGPTAAHAGHSISPGPDGTIPSGPAPLATGDSSAVMPGGTQLSSVESRRRAFHRGVSHIGRQVASALAYAHARGILHRDVKPSNLLLDTEGVVWVSDFGLAKVDDDELTKTGDILGTLRYMAPERFRGQGDARADVYSLGLTLYELLALRPAFDSPDRLALSEQIKAVEPPRPRSIDPRIPRDLETIVLKAIEKGPGDRYATAEAMAEDLRRFLDDEPILARRVAAPERYLRWARRNPWIALLGAALTVVLLVATTSSVLAARRMAGLAQVNEDAARSERSARLDALAAREQAERQRERAEQHLYFARIGQAEGALRLFDSATARGLLDQCRPGPGEPDHRGWEWFYLDQWCRPELRTIALPTEANSHSVAVSPDGRLLAVGCSTHPDFHPGAGPVVPAYLVGLPDGGIRHELVGHEEFVLTVAFRPDGKHLATLGAEGMIRLWEIATGRPLRAIDLGKRIRAVDAADKDFTRLHWSPDGRRLAAALPDDQILIWDPETGRETTRIHHPATTLAWSPDGTRIASAHARSPGVRLWDARDGRSCGPTLGPTSRAWSLAWSPDGRRLAAASIDYETSPVRFELNVWDATSGERVVRVGHVGELRVVAFSPDGTRVATGGSEGIVRVFDAAAGRERAALFTGCMTVNGLAYSPDGRRLYAAGAGMGGVKVFDPDREPRGRGIPGWLDQLGALTFDHEGQRVLGIAWEYGQLAAADPVDGSVAREHLLPVSDARRWPRGDFAFSPDGRWVAAPSRRDGTVVGVWDVVFGRPITTLRGSAGPVTAVAFHPDGWSLATAAVGPAGRATVTLCRLDSGRAIQTFESESGAVEALAFSGDGRKLAAGGGRKDGHGRVIVWDAKTGDVLGALNTGGVVRFVAFDPDGARLAIADFGETKIHLWDLAGGRSITSPGPFAVSCVGFTPDGNRIAALGYDGNIHLCDARTGDEVLVLRGFGGRATGSGAFTPRMAFSPDGRRIAAHDGIGQLLNIWDLRPRSGSAVEPEAGDLAGWLRRGRALAEQGDLAGAEAAYARAGDIEDGDPSLWIEHAASLWRQGDSTRARDALDRAMGALPDDPSRWVDLGRLLGRLGRREESETALAKGRSLLARRLSDVPDDEPAAGALAELLPDTDISRGWTVLRPDAMTSAAGATLTRLPDDSLLAGGLNPAVDTYTVEATTDLSGITGLRLDALLDPRLPHHGPGRSPEGNFLLGSVRLSTVPGSKALVPVDLTRARDSSYPTESFPGASGAIDADPLTNWSNWPLMRRPHWAVFQAARPVGTGHGLRLRVELVFGCRLGLSTPWAGSAFRSRTGHSRSSNRAC
jgi:WD40 repeat protein